MPEPIKYCREHRLSLPCPLCHFNAWPLRDLNAVADFAGKTVDKPEGYVPEIPTIRLSEVIRIIGRRWVELERVKLTCLQPIYATKNLLVREARIGVIDIGKLEIAARQVAKGNFKTGDRAVDLYIETILEDESAW